MKFEETGPMPVRPRRERKHISLEIIEETTTQRDDTFSNFQGTSTSGKGVG